MSESAATKAGKAATATASAEIGTILVVAPRNERFNYSRQDDLIINTGNVSFRVIAYGVCKDPAQDQGRDAGNAITLCPNQNKASKSDVSNSRTRIGIWHGKQFITVK